VERCVIPPPVTQSHRRGRLAHALICRGSRGRQSWSARRVASGHCSPAPPGSRCQALCSVFASRADADDFVQDDPYSGRSGHRPPDRANHPRCRDPGSQRVRLAAGRCESTGRADVTGGTTARRQHPKHTISVYPRPSAGCRREPTTWSGESRAFAQPRFLVCGSSTI
jgi:hypothetical protein